MTTREVARRLDTDPETLRRFLRETTRGVGRGARYDIAWRDVPALRNRFRAWQGVPALW